MSATAAAIGAGAGAATVFLYEQQNRLISLDQLGTFAALVQEIRPFWSAAQYFVCITYYSQRGKWPRIYATAYGHLPNKQHTKSHNNNINNKRNVYK